MDAPNEMGEHGFGDVEIGNDAVAQGTNGNNIGGGAPDHLLGFGANGENAFAAPFNGDDGRFIDGDASPVDKDERICSPQINGDVVRERAKSALNGLVSVRLIIS